MTKDSISVHAPQADVYAGLVMCRMAESLKTSSIENFLQEIGLRNFKEHQPAQWDEDQLPPSVML